MKTRVVIIHVFFLSSLLFSQGKWEWQNPLPQGDNLYNIFTITPTRAVAIGNGGIVLKTEDNGLTWKKMPIQDNWGETITVQLYGIFFIDEQTGWIVGHKNTILRTTNGGSSWEFQSVPQEELDPDDPWSFINQSNYSLYSVHFTDAQTGWAVGLKRDSDFNSSGSIIHTTDGGQTWIDQDADTDEWLYDIQALNSEKAYAVGGDYNKPVLLETTDGGNTWVKRQDVPKYNDQSLTLQKIDFAGQDHGWIVGGTDLTLQTTDGGASWTQVDWSSLEYYLGPVDVSFVSQNIGWILGGYNSQYGTYVLHTENGGNTWTQQNNPANNLRAIHFADAQNGWMVGNSGMLINSTNGGTNWQTIGQAATHSELRHVQFLDENIGYASGSDGAILKTTNGGAAWTNLAFTDDTYLFQDCFFLSDQVGWIGGIGSEHGMWRSQFFGTTDGGQNWTDLAGDWSGNICGIYFVDNQTGWIVGESATIRKTTDGGQTWMLQDNPYSGTTKQLEAVHFANESTGWIVAGHEGKILKTTDGGDTWKDVVTNTNKWLQDCSFVDEKTGWVCGNGVIIYTNDGGETWAPQTLPDTFMDFNTIHFADAQNGIAMGTDHVRTTDGGQTWVLENPGVSSEFQSVWMASENHIWGVGENGMILHWDSGYVPNSPPEIISSAIETATEGEHYIYTAQATDPDGDEITFTFINYQDWLTADGATLSGTPPAGDETTSFTVVASDGSLTDTLVVTLTIEAAPSAVGQSNLIPETLTLQPNYPNPFNPVTRIRFGLPVQSQVEINIFNAAGQKITCLLHGIQKAGYHQIDWQADSYSSGIYTIQLKANGKILTQKTLLMK